jgi:geranyl-CoA carboxylase alpha subunit
VKYHVKIGELEREFRFERRGTTLHALRDDGVQFEVDLSAVGDGGVFSFIVDGHSYDCQLDREQGSTTVQLLGERIAVAVQDERERAAQRVASHKGGGRRAIEAVMPGVVVDVRVREGDIVEDGEALVVLEAMKMQNPIPADGRAKVARVVVKAGDVVAGGDLLVELDDVEAES